MAKGIGLENGQGGISLRNGSSSSSSSSSNNNNNNNNNLIYIAPACRMTSEALADSSSQSINQSIRGCLSSRSTSGLIIECI